MLHVKLFMRCLAWGRWLLAAGLVLGWSGEAVADKNDAKGHNRNSTADHTHATDPKLVLKYDLPVGSSKNRSIIVEWSTSKSMNFGDESDNGDPATAYKVRLYSGSIPKVFTKFTGQVGSATQVGSDGRYADATDDPNIRTHSFTHADIHYRGQEDGDTGEYWVWMEVKVRGDSRTEISTYFAKQIVVQPHYILSVNPNSVREDAGPTNVNVKVRVGDDTAVDADTDVLLGASSEGFNSRFRITMPSLKILKGKKEETAAMIFTPIRTNEDDDSIPDEDLKITIKGDAGSSKIVATTTITLVDADKPSTEINLSFSDTDISKRDGATDIVVTATLNGKKLKKDVSFQLIIPPGESSDTGTAKRDIDYSDTMAKITIPDRKVSGKATITIRPKNAGTGLIWVGAPSDAKLTNDENNPIKVNSNKIEITGDPAKEITGLTPTPFSIREDAGEKKITLKISLQNALLTDETVQFTIEDDSDGLCEDSDSDCPFYGAVNAQRDVDYRADVKPLIIPRGETEGTTTITVTPISNKKEDSPRAFTVNARVGSNKPLSAGILITDDDTPSDSITLEVSPDEINEEAGATEVTVTGTLNGKEFDNDVVVLLVINDDINRDGTVDDKDKAATRDADYTADLHPLVIKGGSVSGTTKITITPIDDDDEEDDEKIGLRTLESRPPIGKDDDDLEDLEVTPVTITLKDTDDEDQRPQPKDPKLPAFADSAAVANQKYAVGTAIAALVLPEATGGDGDLRYSVSTLPKGLSFDAATRTISGTPSEATKGAVNIIYTVIDDEKDAAALTFSITVNADETPPPSPTADAQLTAVPSSIREDAEEIQISLTVALAAPKKIAEIVRFTLVDPSEGTKAVRDVDYKATLGKVVSIPVGDTVGKTTFTIRPQNNGDKDGPRMLGVQAAFASGGTLSTNIEIADDETSSTSIALSVSPTVIAEGDTSTVKVTATLNGKPLQEEAIVTVSIDNASTATRDVDYSSKDFNPRLVIPAGKTTGATTFTIICSPDDIAEGNETIKLTGDSGLEVDAVEITLSDRAAEAEEPEAEEASLAFPDDAPVDDQVYTAGWVIADLVLPAATGGDGDLTYSVSALPKGLSFDAATRTISGTPSEATDGAVNIIYMVIDYEKDAAALTFSITVNTPLEFDLKDFFDFFSGMGKANPTSDPTMLAAIDGFVVGQRVAGLVLPVGTGGTAPLTYSLSPGLPAGLSFDPVTRTVSGIPTAEGQPVYTYTVTDAHGAQASLSLQTRPTAFALADNYPNPFNPSTTIRYALPQASDVELRVYNVVGQAVRTLVSEHQSAGRYVIAWDATNDSGQHLSSGLYFYHLQVGGQFHDVKKMLLLK